MTAIEDPAAQLNSAAAGPGRSPDELEDWLSDLRTDVAADPPGWITEEPADEQPDERSPLPPEQGAPSAPEPSRGGRHRAPE